MVHAPDRTQSIGRYTAFFLGVFFVMQLFSQASRDTAPWRFMINDLTVAPSALIINWLTPDEAVTAQGHRLISPHVRLSVLNGCEGVDVILLLTAALVAANIPLRRLLLGVVLGGLLIHALNLTRITSLYYCLRFDRAWFEAAHGYIAPISVIICAIIFFLFWVNYDGPRESR